MAGKLSFSIAINLLTENFKKGTSKVQSMFAKMKGSVLGFAAVLGIGGASLRGFIETTAGFEAAVSKLSAILGTTPDQIKALTDNAKKLGETTKYTAAEATNLQTELAKLGFTKNEILSATESVLKFAQATDAGLAEAAALAGAALRMFGAEASESKRYVSAMSIATTKSALSFAYLRDALPTVGPVAKAFNFEIEDTLALLGKLADSGFDASSAATATRNILLNLADSGGKLAIALGGPVRTLPELVAGLQKLKDKGVDLNTTLQLTDKRSVAAFNAFLQSADKITPLRDAITGVEGDLDQMASTMGDNVKGAMAGLGSAWEALMIKLSENTNGPLKDMINWFTGLLRDLKSGFSGVVAFIITLVSGKLLAAIAGYFMTFSKLIDTTLNKAKVTEEQKLLLTQKRIEVEKAYEATLTQYNTIENGKRLATKKELNKAMRALNVAELAEKRAIDNAKVASDNAASVKTTTIFGKAAKTIKLAWASVAMTLKSLWSAVWPMALITAIATVVGKLVNMRKEAKRVKSIFSEYKAEVEKVGNTQEVVMLKTQLSIMNDKKKSLNEINNAQAQLQKMLGVENKSQEELNKLIAKRVQLLEETAKAQYYANKIPEIENNNKELSKRFKKDYGGKEGYSMDDMVKTISDYGYLNKSGLPMGFRTKYGLNGTETGIRNGLDEYMENLRSLSDAREGIKNAQIKANALAGNTGGNGNNDPDQTELQKQQERYAQSLRELNARKEVEKLTTDEYNKAYDELNRKSLIEAKSSDDKAVLNSKYIKLLQDKVDNPLYKEDKVQIELAKVEKEYQTSVSLAKTKLDKKLISEEEYRQAIIAAAMAAANSAVSIERIGDAADDFVKEMQGVVLENTSLSLTPILGKRDTTFDYKLSGTDKLSGDLDVWKKYRDDLQAAVNDGADYLTKELNDAISKVDNLEDALKITQVKEDIKSFSKELNAGLYSGVKNIASSSDRMVSAFENLRDVMNDVDASGWERIMAVWNAMTNTIDGLMSIIKTIETLTELTNKLARAKEAEAAIDTATTATKVTNKTAETTAEITALGTQTAAEVTASTAKTTAASVEMAAKSTAAYAYIPFAGPALAAAQIATMQALIAAAAIPKFASGGIVTGGPSSGDKILARVNAGEMILNGRQQSNLFEAINSGKLNSAQNQSVNIGFDKVRGSDIYLSLKNYMKSTGKKL